MRSRMMGVLVTLAAGVAAVAGGVGSPGSPAAGSRVRVAASVLPAVALPGIGDQERGNRHFRAGRYGEAVEAYRAALEDGEDGPVLRYNLGTALLRLGRYAEAEEHLRSALDVVEPETREWVYYNLGQRFLEDARGPSTDPQATTALYDAAVEAYRQALRLQPQDADAKWNYELALRERDEQQQAGGGGGGDEGEDQDQGSGGEARGSPSESPAGGQSQGQSPMSREQAERILSAVEQDERELFQDKLRKGAREARPARDW